MSKYKHGEIIWRDLTVENTDEIKKFYGEVVGWKTTDHNMGEYNDYNVIPRDSDEVITGIVNKRGVNKDLPSHWINYIYVDDVKVAVEKALELGGKILVPLRDMGGSDFAVIEDPAGAIFGLIH